MEENMGCHYCSGSGYTKEGGLVIPCRCGASRNRGDPSLKGMYYVFAFIGALLPIVLFVNIIRFNGSVVNYFFGPIEYQWLNYVLVTLIIIVCILIGAVFYYICYRVYRYEILLMPLLIGAGYVVFTVTPYLENDFHQRQLVKDNQSRIKISKEFYNSYELSHSSEEHKKILGIWAVGEHVYKIIFSTGDMFALISSPGSAIREIHQKWNLISGDKLQIGPDIYTYKVTLEKLFLSENIDGETLVYKNRRLKGKKGANIRDRYFYEAAKRGLLQPMIDAVNNGTSINATFGKSLDTALMAASRRGYSDIVEYLLKMKVNHNFKDSDGYTAYEHAVAGKHEPVIQLLKKHNVRAVG